MPSGIFFLRCNPLESGFCHAVGPNVSGTYRGAVSLSLHHLRGAMHTPRKFKQQGGDIMSRTLKDDGDLRLTTSQYLPFIRSLNMFPL